MMDEFKIQKLIGLLRDGRRECNKLDNRRYISFGELVMKFYDLTYQDIPLCVDRETNGEISNSFYAGNTLT